MSLISVRGGAEIGGFSCGVKPRNHRGASVSACPIRDKHTAYLKWTGLLPRPPRRGAPFVVRGQQGPCATAQLAAEEHPKKHRYSQQDITNPDAYIHKLG